MKIRTGQKRGKRFLVILNNDADEDQRQALAAACRRFFAGGTDNECTRAGVFCSVLSVRAGMLLAFYRL